MTTAIAANLTTVDTEQRHALGQRYIQPAGSDGLGEIEYIYVRNVSGATIGAGRGVERDLSVGDAYNCKLTTASSSASRPAGIVPENLDSAFVDDAYAWVVRRGRTGVDAAAATTLGAGITPSATAGEFADVAAAVDGACGYWVEAIGAAGIADAVVDCKG